MILFHQLLVLCFLGSIVGFLCFTHRHVIPSSHGGLKSNIDPFDQIKGPVDALVNLPSNKVNDNLQDKVHINRRSSLLKRLENISNISESISAVNYSGSNSLIHSVVKTNIGKYIKSEDEVATAIELCQGKILESLPLNVYRSFIPLCQRYVERVAFIAFATHIMVLIPFLRYVHLELHVSVVPYIYYGPIAAVTPFVVLWLWLNNVVELSFFDELFTRYMISQKDSAVTKLRSEEESLMEILRSTEVYDTEVLKVLSACKLFMKVDVPAMRDEVYALKGRNGWKRKIKTATYRADSAIEMQRSGAIDGNANTITAVKLLLGAAELKGLTSEQTLDELRKLQGDLDKLNKT